MLLDERGRIRADLKVAEASVPESIRLVVGERLSRLSRRTREALVAAAVSGRIFAPDFVGEVAGVDTDALVDPSRRPKEHGSSPPMEISRSVTS